MGYNYSLCIAGFHATDCELCLSEIRQAAPDIGDDMRIENGTIFFEPNESYSKWHSAENIAIPIIMRYLPQGEACRIEWEGEDGDRGGCLLTHEHQHDIVYKPVVVMEGHGEVTPEEAAKIIAAGRQ